MDFLGFAVPCFWISTEVPHSLHPDHLYQSVRDVALLPVSAESAVPMILPSCPLLGNQKANSHTNNAAKHPRETILPRAQTILPTVFSLVPSMDTFFCSCISSTVS